MRTDATVLPFEFKTGTSSKVAPASKGFSFLFSSKVIRVVSRDRDSDPRRRPTSEVAQTVTNFITIYTRRCSYSLLAMNIRKPRIDVGVAEVPDRPAAHNTSRSIRTLRRKGD